METARDLARNDPWRESLERSRARRGKAKRSNLLALGARALIPLALLAAVLPGMLGGGSRHPARTAHASVLLTNARADDGGPFRVAAVGAPRKRSACPFVVTGTGYENPLAGATVKPERIDMGVDYAGSGTLVAMAPAKVTYVGTSGTGWPGAFVEYRLLAGPDAGCYVYYAEGVTPEPSLTVGEVLTAGQAVASIIPGYPTGIELGWGTGKSTETYAAAAGNWSAADDQDNVASAAGKNFSQLIAALGGPAGKVEG